MKHLNIKEIHMEQEKKMRHRYQSFDIILEICYKRIQNVIDTFRNTFFCLYEIPEFMIGYPIYDLNECVMYIIQKLSTNGFKVKYFFPRVILVSWENEKTSNQYALPVPKLEPKPKTKTKTNTRMKTTGKFILDLS